MWANRHFPRRCNIIGIMLLLFGAESAFGYTRRAIPGSFRSRGLVFFYGKNALSFSIPFLRKNPPGAGLPGAAPVKKRHSRFLTMGLQSTARTHFVRTLRGLRCKNSDVHAAGIFDLIGSRRARREICDAFLTYCGGRCHFIPC